MINKLASNYLRVTSALQIENANSGHPGVCLGAAPMVFSIYKNALVSPKDPNFINRDRVVFSAGHASALIYACLNLFGYDISTNDLKNFRKFGSITSGHPEVKVAPGVDVSTGPLGQGIANAVGLAIAEDFLNNKFKRKGFSPVDHYTYCFTGDGCLMEGVAQEAISIAGNLKLNKLILLYDRNDITIEGNLSIANSEDVEKKFAACNWNVLLVKDGNNVKEVDKAIQKAQKSNKPTVIIVKTQIGYGSSLVGSNKVHGKPLNKEQINILRQNLGYIEPDWQIPQDLKNYVDELLSKKKSLYDDYQQKLTTYKQNFPNEYKELYKSCQNVKIDLSKFKSKPSEKFDGRQALHEVLNYVAEKVPSLIGGCADVAPSTKAYIASSQYYCPKNKDGRNIPYGIREHAMGAISNGLSLHGGLNVFCSTFFAFANYMTPAIRLSALMKTPVLYLFTHDSISAGEDGPTHQSIEQIATLRSMPDVYTFRPSGLKELQASFQFYFDSQKPCCVLIPRQETSLIEDNFEGALKGAYVISSPKNYDATIVSTGSEVSLALESSKALEEQGINVRVVSMPCVELFDSQTTAYKKSVIDKSKPVICVEASGDNVWYKYATDEEALVTVTSFGASGKGDVVYSYYGFNVKNICNKVKKYLKSLNK